MKRLWITMAGVLIFHLLIGSEPAQTSKNDNLRQKPFSDAKIVIALKNGQNVDIQKREGSWYFVKSGAKTGWVPMLSIHRTQKAATATAGSLSTVSTGRSSAGGVVSTTGVRGINEETLKKAEFSESAVAAVEKYRVLKTDAAAFAEAAGLKARTVPSLSSTTSVGGKQ